MDYATLINPTEHMRKLLDEEVTWSVNTKTGVVRIFDHAEGRSAEMTIDEIVENIAQDLAVDCTAVTEYDRFFATNIVANCPPKGLAYYVYSVTDV